MPKLTNEERARFIAYLESKAANDELLARQVEVMGFTHATMASELKTEVAACRLVIAKLKLEGD